MKNFDYQTPTRLIFGRDVVAGLPEVMRPFGRRILLTYGGGSIKRIGLYDRVKELLKDFEIFELGGIEPNPKYSTSVVEGVRICKEQQIDVILSVGGGSVLDCSKAIAGGAKYDLIVPAPMKPMPLTTWAAIRPGSKRVPSWSARKPSKPYCETIIINALPRATRKWVRKPASLTRYSRSRPITVPQRPATQSRRIKFHSIVSSS